MLKIISVKCLKLFCILYYDIDGTSWEPEKPMVQQRCAWVKLKRVGLVKAKLPCQLATPEKRQPQVKVFLDRPVCVHLYLVALSWLASNKGRPNPYLWHYLSGWNLECLRKCVEHKHESKWISSISLWVLYQHPALTSCFDFLLWLP